MAGEYAFLARHARARTKFTMPAPSYHRRYWSPEHSPGLPELRGIPRRHPRIPARSRGGTCSPWVATTSSSTRQTTARFAIRTPARRWKPKNATRRQRRSSTPSSTTRFSRARGRDHGDDICRGNGPGGAGHSAGGYGAISRQLFPRLGFGRLLLEYDSERAGGFQPLTEVRPGTGSGLGAAYHQVRSAGGRGRDRGQDPRGGRGSSPGELALSTQCGFASVPGHNPVSPAGQWAKLDLVTRVARRIWPG